MLHLSQLHQIMYTNTFPLNLTVDVFRPSFSFFQNDPIYFVRLQCSYDAHRIEKKTGTQTNYHTLWMVWFGWLNRCVDRQFDGDVSVSVSECVCFFLRSRLLVRCSNLFTANSFDVIELTIVWLRHKCHKHTHTYAYGRMLHLYGILYLT